MGFAPFARGDLGSADLKPYVLQELSQRPRLEAGVQVSVSLGDVHPVVSVQRQHGDASSRTRDPSRLAQGDARLLRVREGVEEDDLIERGVIEGQRVHVAEQHVDVALTKPPARRFDKLRTQIEPRVAARPRRQHAAGPPVPTPDVEHITEAHQPAEPMPERFPGSSG